MNLLNFQEVVSINGISRTSLIGQELLEQTELVSRSRGRSQTETTRRRVTNVYWAKGVAQGVLSCYIVMRIHLQTDTHGKSGWIKLMLPCFRALYFTWWFCPCPNIHTSIRIWLGSNVSVTDVNWAFKILKPIGDGFSWMEGHVCVCEFQRMYSAFS